MTDITSTEPTETTCYCHVGCNKCRISSERSVGCCESLLLACGCGDGRQQARRNAPTSHRPGEYTAPPPVVRMRRPQGGSSSTSPPFASLNVRSQSLPLRSFPPSRAGRPAAEPVDAGELHPIGGLPTDTQARSSGARVAPLPEGGGTSSITPAQRQPPHLGARSGQLSRRPSDNRNALEDLLRSSSSSGAGSPSRSGRLYTFVNPAFDRSRSPAESGELYESGRVLDPLRPRPAESTTGGNRLPSEIVSEGAHHSPRSRSAELSPRSTWRHAERASVGAQSAPRSRLGQSATPPSERAPTGAHNAPHSRSSRLTTRSNRRAPRSSGTTSI
jgi:hypothetical protein